MSLQKLFTALTLLAGGIATGANAGEIEKPYVGLDYSVFTFDAGSSVEFKPHAARVRAGSVLTKFLAVEAHAGTGIKGDTITVNFGAPVGVLDVRSDVESLYAVFLRPQISAGNLHLYALAGYGYAKMELSLPHTDVNADEDSGDVSFGGGAELYLDTNWGVNINYIRYQEDVESFGAGVAYRF